MVSPLSCWWSAPTSQHAHRVSAISRFVSFTLLLALFVLTSARPVAAAPRAGSVDPARIDAFVAAEVQANRIPGLALGLVHGNQIV
jgi:CubicO group peptidase (beta-lactamase class C family)